MKRYTLNYNTYNVYYQQCLIGKVTDKKGYQACFQKAVQLALKKKIDPSKIRIDNEPTLKSQQSHW